MQSDQELPAATILHQAVTGEALAELLRRKGYRAELTLQGGQPHLASASSGVPFHVKFANPATKSGIGDPGVATFLDFAFICALQVEAVTTSAVANWNRNRRFARAYEQSPLTVLELDVLLAGGVTDAHLATTVEVWDHLLQEWLRQLRALVQVTPPSA